MIDTLVKRIQETNAPICVGLDPMLSYIPEHILEEGFEAKGDNLEGAAEAVWLFNKEIIDATYDLIPAVKPQVAMYEQFGVQGMIAFRRTLGYCKTKGLVVIGDIKRGDIGSTSEAYAAGHIGKVVIKDKEFRGFHEDFVTVNPYLGSDGVKPFIKVGKENKKGLFCLVKTSNPSSGEFQDQMVGDKPVYQLVAEKVAEWGSDFVGECGYSYVGAVVGATYPEVGKKMRAVMPNNYILVPGYGAQGGTAKDLVHYFNPDGLGAIVNSSRGIIAAWKQEKYAKFGPRHFAEAARQAVIDMQKDIASVL